LASIRSPAGRWVSILGLALTACGFPSREKLPYGDEAQLAGAYAVELRPYGLVHVFGPTDQPTVVSGLAGQGLEVRACSSAGCSDAWPTGSGRSAGGRWTSAVVGAGRIELTFRGQRLQQWRYEYRAHPALEPVALALAQARTHHQRGASPEARKAYETAAQVAASCGVPSAHTAMLRAAAYVAVGTSNFPRARRLLDEADEASEVWGLGDDEFASDFMRAYLASRTFDHAGAVAYQLRALRSAQRSAQTENITMVQRTLPLTLLEAGREREARRYLHEAAPSAPAESGARLRQLSNRAWLALHGVLGDAESLAAIAEEMDNLRRELREGFSGTPAREFCINRAHLARRLAQPDTALVWLNRARKHMGSGVEPSLEQAVLRAGVLTELGHPGEAAALYQKVQDSPRLQEQPQFAPEVAWGQSRLQAQQGLHAQARRSARRAARAFVQLLHKAGTVHSRAAFVVSHRAFVGQLLSFFLEHGHLAEAFELADGLRSRMLAAWSHQARLSRVSTEDRRRWERSLSQWRRLEREIHQHRELVRTGAMQVSLDAQRRLPGLLQAKDAALADALAVLGAGRALAQVEDVQGVLRSGEVVVISTEATTEAHGSTSVLIQVERAQVSLLKGPKPAGHRFVIQASTSSASLPGWVFEGSWSYIPSAAWLVETRQSDRPEPAQLRPGLIVSDPDFTLRGARAEGRALRRLWPTARWLQGADANLQRLRAELGAQPAFLHIGAHVETPGEQPERAFVRLHDGQRLGVEEFGFIGLPAVPVILTACHATRALQLPGGGRLSLGALFLVAGARSVVGPRSLIDDNAAGLFGVAFHTRSGLSSPGATLLALRQDRSLGGVADEFVLLGEP